MRRLWLLMLLASPVLAQNRPVAGSASPGVTGPVAVDPLGAARSALLASLEKSGLEGLRPGLLAELGSLPVPERAAFSQRLAAVAAELAQEARSHQAELPRLSAIVSVLSAMQAAGPGYLTEDAAAAVQAGYEAAVRSRSGKVAEGIETTAAALGAAAVESGVPYPDIASRLKTETRQLHTQAERHPFQRGLLLRTKRPDYVRWLGQMLHVHSALETRLGDLRPGVGALQAVVKDHQFQQVNLKADLAHFGVDPADVKPLPAAGEFAALVDRVAADAVKGPYFLLGMQYVLEGSKNGGFFVAKAVRFFLGLKAGSGDRYLSPYGSEQKARWQEFKADLNSLALSREQEAALVAGASAMFLSAIRLNDDLLLEKEGAAVASGYRRWLRRGGKLVFLFFLIKGLAWVLVPLFLYWLSR